MSITPDAVRPVLYSGHPLHYPFAGIQTSWSLALRAQAAADLALITEEVPKFATHTAIIAFDADVEDFWENTARAAAAIRAARALGRPFEIRDQDAEWNGDLLGQRLGPVAKIEESRHSADPLLMHPMLQAHGGRWMSMAGYTDEPGEFQAEHDVVQVVLSRARQGVPRVVIKLAARKSGVFTLDLHTEMTAEDVDRALHESVDGWELVRLAGRRDSILVQDWIEMTCEYRLFIVDGELISGAGCIEEFTPYSRERADVQFDTRVRDYRGHGIVADENSRVRADPELVARYREVGEQLAREYGGTIVIDVALDRGADRVVMVELNTLPNSGLYASDPDAVYLALAEAEDHGYSAYAWAERTTNAPTRTSTH